MDTTKDLGLPRTGPFAVEDGFATKTVLKATAVAVLLAALSGVTGWLTVSNVGKVLHVQRVWAEGVDAGGEVGFEGEVTTRNFVLKSYDLEIQFQDRLGRVRSFDCEFDRFFTGPEERDPIEVRYLEDDPAQATTSWQHDAVPHMWIWILITAAMAVGAATGAVYMVASAVATVGRVKELARSGQLIAVEVIEAEAQVVEKVTTVTMKLALPGGGETKHVFQEGKTDPYLVDDGTRVLALASLDGLTIHPLRHDGHPIDLAPLGIGV